MNKQTQTLFAIVDSVIINSNIRLWCKTTNDEAVNGK